MSFRAERGISQSKPRLHKAISVTHKVSTEIAAETAGVLDTIVPEGQEVKIGEVVATIDDSKKAPEEKKAEKPKEKKEKAEEPSPQSSPPGRGGKEEAAKKKTADGEAL